MHNAYILNLFEYLNNTYFLLLLYFATCMNLSNEAKCFLSRNNSHDNSGAITNCDGKEKNTRLVKISKTMRQVQRTPRECCKIRV